MAWNISSLGGMATTQVTSAFQAHNYRGQVAGSKKVGRVQGYKEEIQVRPAQRTMPQARLRPSKRQQAARCEVLSVEDRPLPHWPIPRVDEEAAHR